MSASSRRIDLAVQLGEPQEKSDFRLEAPGVGIIGQGGKVKSLVLRGASGEVRARAELTAASTPGVLSFLP